MKSPLSQYELNKVTLTEPSKQYGGIYSGLANHGHNGLAENNPVNGHAIGGNFPILTRPHAPRVLPALVGPPPLKKEIGSPIKIKGGPTSDLLNGQIGHVKNSVPSPQLLLNNFDDGFADGKNLFSFFLLIK